MERYHRQKGMVEFKFVLDWIHWFKNGRYLVICIIFDVNSVDPQQGKAV